MSEMSTKKLAAIRHLRCWQVFKALDARLSLSLPVSRQLRDTGLSSCLLLFYFTTVSLFGFTAELDLARLAAHSAAAARETARVKSTCFISTDAERDLTLQTNLSQLLEAGAPQVKNLLLADEVLLTAILGSERPVTATLNPRLYHDLTKGRYIIEPGFESSRGSLSVSAWFFYHNYFTAYAGLHPGFREADSPLARGVAALAALSNTRQSNLALLPAWLSEAALAALLLNADPDLVGSLKTLSPQDPELLRQIIAALQLAGLVFSDTKAGLILGDTESIFLSQFTLRHLLPDSYSARAKLWDFALENLAYPSFVAELGAAIWTRQTLTSAQLTALDEVSDQLLDQIEENSLVTEAPKSVLDPSALIAIFGFVWSYRPEFDAWRQKALDIAALPDGHLREARSKDLERQLADMLSLDNSASVPSAARLSRLFLSAKDSEHPQPRLALVYAKRLAADDEDDPEPPKLAANLRLQWLFKRSFPWGEEFEDLFFIGAAGQLVIDEEEGDLDKVRVAFVRPGLDTGQHQADPEQIRFTGPEQAYLQRSFREVENEWKKTRWTAKQVKQPDLFRNLLSLYYAVPKTVAASEFVNKTLAEPKRQVPAWTETVFRAWRDSREVFLTSGNPEDLYLSSSYYMFLLPLGFITGNDSFSLSLLNDFLKLTLTIALAEHPEQPQRADYFDDPLWHLTEAWHWTRDIIALVRDGNPKWQAWVRPDRDLAQLMRPFLNEFNQAEGTKGFYQEKSGQIELGGLWVQIYKSRHSAEGVPDLQAILAGKREFRFTCLLASPSQNPAEIFAVSAFDENGPYAFAPNLRSILGIRLSLMPE